MDTKRVIQDKNALALRQVLMDVRDALTELDLDSCDIDDVREVIEKAESELDRSSPSVDAVGIYLNSIARSLRAQPNVRTVVMELDAAMHAANVVTNWEH